MSTTASSLEPAYIAGPSSEVESDSREREGHREEELVRAARAGDKNAFGEIYRSRYASIYRLAQFSLGAGAEDAASETFLRAWRSLDKYREGRATFISWLYGIARHVVTDELRRRGRVEIREDMPENGVEHDRDTRLLLEPLLARLPRDQRIVIEMKFLLGMTNPEVATALDKTTGAVNAIQWRALRTLRGWMEGS